MVNRDSQSLTPTINRGKEGSWRGFFNSQRAVELNYFSLILIMSRHINLKVIKHYKIILKSEYYSLCDFWTKYLYHRRTVAVGRSVDRIYGSHVSWIRLYLEYIQYWQYIIQIQSNPWDMRPVYLYFAGVKSVLIEFIHILRFFSNMSEYTVRYILYVYYRILYIL